MKRAGTIWGIILILVGVGLLALQRYPDWFSGFTWPWIVIGLGGIFLIVGLLSREGGFMVPAAMLLGIGGILLYQVQTGDWASWAYMWMLIPGFVGLGILLGGLFDANLARARGGALIVLIISLIAFGIFGGLGLDLGLLRYWPLLLIGLGVWFVFKAVMGPRQNEKEVGDQGYKNG